MNALEIAKGLDAEIARTVKLDILHHGASEIIRRQHEAIQKLRNAAAAIIDYGNSYEAAQSDWPEWDAKYDALEQAIKDTEEFQ